MTAADDIAELRKQLATQQQQLVELRLVMSQREDREAALIKHLVTSEVIGQLDDRLPSKLEKDHLTSLFNAAVQRARNRNDLFMHFAKWGAGGALAFFLYAGWESVKAKLGIQPGAR